MHDRKQVAGQEARGIGIAIVVHSQVKPLAVIVCSEGTVEGDGEGFFGDPALAEFIWDGRKMGSDSISERNGL